MRPGGRSDSVRKNSCYRGAIWMSTRILGLALATAIALLIANARAIQSSGREAAAEALPANALKNSASLYLREAASSPVRWQPWSAASFALARKLNRPVLIDIGAVWCHWCHVMDEQTYGDREVADVINRSFVPIKIDADERPDIDAYYQDAASRLAGVSGWPLTCFTTPDGGLFLAFGYMPPKTKARPGESAGGAQGMVAILKRVADVYRTDRATLESEARDLRADLRSEEGATRRADGFGALEVGILHSLEETYDAANGGFRMGGDARFYDFPAIEVALAHGFFGSPKFTQIAIDSLKRIAAGGVYDQLGGGFHRYSTDAQWRVPHFEKMLYDQAMAIETYSLAYEQSGDEDLARIARQTIGYVNREMLDPATHTFYSHQDADAFKGDDGSYYTWTADELARLLAADEQRSARLYFGFDDDPARAPDGRIVLRRALTRDELAKRLGLPRARSDAILDRAIAKMRAARDKRRRPLVDHMIFVDRNALAAQAYLVASAALQEATLRRIALDDIDFILAHARMPDGAFYHAYANGKAAVPGLVADQVYMLQAMLAAYQASGEKRYLDQSRKLASLLMKNYRDGTSGLLRDHPPKQSGTPNVDVAPSPDVMFDRPMPSVQATAALAFRTLAALTGDTGYDKQADDLLSPSGRVNPSAASMLGTLGLALEQRAHGETVIAIVGPSGSADDKTEALRQTALRTYRPGKVVMVLDSRAANDSALPPAARAMFDASKKRAETLAFVCAGTACANPVSDSSALAKLIREFQVTPGPVARGVGS
jgi:uncharacterized protein